MIRHISRHFQIYADGKRVKEISREEWRETIFPPHIRLARVMTVRIHGKEVWFHKGKNSIYLTMDQLIEIMKRVRHVPK